MGFSRQEHWSRLPCPPPGDLPTKGSNPGLPHCRQIYYHLNHLGSPRILEWVAYPFSRGSSNPGMKLGSPALQEDSFFFFLVSYQGCPKLQLPSPKENTYKLNHCFSYHNFQGLQWKQTCLPNTERWATSRLWKIIRKPKSVITYLEIRASSNKSSFCGSISSHPPCCPWVPLTLPPFPANFSCSFPYSAHLSLSISPFFLLAVKETEHSNYFFLIYFIEV